MTMTDTPAKPTVALVRRLAALAQTMEEGEAKTASMLAKRVVLFQQMKAAGMTNSAIAAACGCGRDGQPRLGEAAVRKALAKAEAEAAG